MNQDSVAQAAATFGENFAEIIEGMRAVRGERFASVAIGTFELAQITGALSALCAHSTIPEEDLQPFMGGVITLISSVNARLAEGMSEEHIGEIQRFAMDMAKRKIALDEQIAAALRGDGP